MHTRVAFAALVVFASSIPGAACLSHLEDDCNARNCAQSGGAGQGANPQGGNGGQGGQGGGTPAGCIPADNDAAVANDCGVFVSSSLGNDANEGTKEKPFATIMAAIGAAGSGDVYVCAEAFSEAVTLPSGISLYGGLGCANDWAYTADKVQLTAAADSIPLTLSAGTNETRIEDFAITAQNATILGGSSIAVLANEATAGFARCDLVAGNGMAGAIGTAPTGGDLDGGPGHEGDPSACTNASEDGGLGADKQCGLVDVSGGIGGDGTMQPNGLPGGPGNPVVPGSGDGGPGQRGSSCGTGWITGQGLDGNPGNPGLGASGHGTLGISGYIGGAGQAGQSAGEHGQGGGGGGGGRECQLANTMAGPGGGGGGSGGCGGLPGDGGQGGGASIALVSIGSTLTLTTCALTSALGADGGEGSAGQAGGTGGSGGDAGMAPGGGQATAGCDGATGGQGGRGGAGGGGTGGHSLGIAFTGTEPVHDGATINPGTAGMGGDGGDGGPGNIGGNGDNGTAAETLSFD